MSDVRLTAINPEDSSVVPVACNSRGELLVEDPSAGPDYLELAGGNLTGDLTLGSDAEFPVTTFSVTGNANFGDRVQIFPNDGTRALNVLGDEQGAARLRVLSGNSSQSRGSLALTSADTTNPSNQTSAFTAGSESDPVKVRIGHDGTGYFSGDVVIGSRNRQWMIVESNGLAHLVDQAQVLQSENPAVQTNYPELRDIPSELTMVEQQLQKVMERLKMAPEAGWEIWDGSD